MAIGRHDIVQIILASSPCRISSMHGFQYAHATKLGNYYQIRPIHRNIYVTSQTRTVERSWLVPSAMKYITGSMHVACERGESTTPYRVNWLAPVTEQLIIWEQTPRLDGSVHFHRTYRCCAAPVRLTCWLLLQRLCIFTLSAVVASSGALIRVNSVPVNTHSSDRSLARNYRALHINTPSYCQVTFRFGLDWG